jgi:energy-coupling factor transporter transmembrane protein EcfT
MRITIIIVSWLITLVAVKKLWPRWKYGWIFATVIVLYFCFFWNWNWVIKQPEGPKLPIEEVVWKWVFKQPEGPKPPIEEVVPRELLKPLPSHQKHTIGDWTPAPDDSLRSKRQLR